MAVELLEMPLDEQLRAAIAESGLSANQLAKIANVSQTTVSRFIAGGDIRLSVAQRLAAHFNLGLLPMPPEQEKPTKKAPRKGS